MPRLITVSLALVALCALSTHLGAQPPFGKEDPFTPKAPGAVERKLPRGFDKLGDVELAVVPAKAKWGETVTVVLTVRLKDDSTTYPFFPKDTKQDSRNGLPESLPVGDLIFIGKPTDPPGLKEKPRDENNPSGPMDQYYQQPVVTWEFKAVVSPRAKPGPKLIDLGDTSVQVCKTKCITASGDQLPAAAFEVLEGASDRVKPDDLTAALAVLSGRSLTPPLVPGGPPTSTPGTSAPPGPTPVQAEVRKPYKETTKYDAEMRAYGESVQGGGKKAEQPLWPFILTAAAWGLISLVTPCVFPMIPITVSIFLKQAHGSFRERLKLASVYSLTIILVLGVSAFALLKFMAWLSVHPATNMLLAGIFLVLALSLFGMYEIALPNALQKRLQARQAQGGTIGTIFGALAFTVISFTCVAPFLGGFAGISAASETGSMVIMPTAREIAGGLAFATAFAAPFFVLALVPGLMKALPKSGGWLDSVKVVMGFLELAAALKFLRNAELGLLPTTQYFTYDVVLGGWVVLSAACGLYLLNLFRLPHDEERPNIGVPRLLFALMFLGLALYLVPGLFKGHDGKPQRPAGAVYAWVEAFLLPEDAPATDAKADEVWRADLQDTIVASNKSGKPIFVDFTGVTCTNCKINERDVFPRAEIREQFQKFEKIKLYTDWVPPDYYVSDPGFEARKAEGRINRDFQLAAFGDIALPLYAVLMPQPDGTLKVLGVYDEGKINDPAKFAAFLKDCLEKAKK